MRFLGNIEARTDAKGRVFLPALFRKILAASGVENIMLRQDIFENLLVIYPENVWNLLMDQMRNRLSRWARKQHQAYRTFVSNVVCLTLDASGRILIPRNFLEATGIRQAVRFVGMGDTIEIWPNDDDSEKPLMDKKELDYTLGNVMGEETKEADSCQNSK